MWEKVFAVQFGIYGYYTGDAADLFSPDAKRAKRFKNLDIARADAAMIAKLAKGRATVVSVTP